MEGAHEMEHNTGNLVGNCRIFMRKKELFSRIMWVILREFSIFFKKPLYFSGKSSIMLKCIDIYENGTSIRILNFGMVAAGNQQS